MSLQRPVFPLQVASRLLGPANAVVRVPLPVSLLRKPIYFVSVLLLMLLPSSSKHTKLRCCSYFIC
jgi:hypothetical protein